MSDTGKPIIWEGTTPSNLEEIEKFVRNEMQSHDIDMERPSKLVFSDVSLTGDHEGLPWVVVWGEKDNDLYFLAKYHEAGEG